METEKLEKLLGQVVEQQALILARQNEMEERLSRPLMVKDGWDRLAALAPIFSAMIMALIGAYFTVTYNQQQLKVQEIQTIEKFIPHLIGTEQSKRAAILAISSLGNNKLAGKVASIFASQGTVSALHTIAANTSDKNEKTVADTALAHALDRLGDRYRTENRYAEAVDAYKKAIAIKEANLPADHPEIAADVENLAQLYESHGEKAAAKDVRKRAIGMARREGLSLPGLSGFSDNKQTAEVKADGGRAEAASTCGPANGQTLDSVSSDDSPAQAAPEPVGEHARAVPRTGSGELSSNHPTSPSEQM